MKKVIAIIGFVAMAIWMVVLTYACGPEHFAQNSAITVALIFLSYLLLSIGYNAEKEKARTEGRKQVYEEICSGVDMKKIPVEGEKFFKKTIVFTIRNGVRDGATPLKSSIEEIEKIEFDVLKRRDQ